MMFWRRRDRPPSMAIGPPSNWPLSTPLCRVSDCDVITIGDAMENIWIYGGTGSGKTTTSAYLIIKQMLKLGFSGLILPVKSNEKGRFVRLMEEVGRADDLVIFGDGGPNAHRFNFFNDMVERFGQFGGCTENILNVLEELQEVINRASSIKQGRGDETFWVLSRRELARNVIDLLILATGGLSAQHIVEVIRDAPRSIEQAGNLEWQSQSVIPTLVKMARQNVGDGPLAHDLQLVEDYFRISFPGLAEKTRSVVEASLLSMLDLFVRGKLHRLFGGQTTITPDDIIDQGKVVFVDTPIKSDYGIGLIAQTLWKRFFQQALERRIDPDRRPAFILMDECQATITTQDQQFASTSRAARCVNIFMSQSVTNIAAAFGGDEGGKSIAEALMGLGQVRIFHQNSDQATNQAAADLFGRRKQRMRSLSLQHPQHNPYSPFRPEPTASSSSSEQWEHVLPPHIFTSLLKPAAPYHMAETVVYHGGRRWAATGDTWIRTFFPQGF